MISELFLAHVALAQTVGKYQGPEATIQQFLCTPTINNSGTGNGTGSGSFSGLTNGKGIAGIGSGGATTDQISAQAGASNTASNDLYNCINRVYRFAIVLASVAGVLLIVIAGYIYMSAEGNSESVDKAKSIITSTITALVILFVGYILLRALNPDLIQFRNIQPPSVNGNQPQSTAQQQQNAQNDLNCIQQNASAAQGTGGPCGTTTNNTTKK